MHFNISIRQFLKPALFGFAIACAALVPAKSSAQTLLVSYNGTSASPATVDVADGVTASDFTAHGSVSFTTGANFPGHGEGYDTTGWPTGTTPPTYNFQSLSFSITADALHQIELTKVQMWFKSSGNGPDKVKLQLTVSDALDPFNETVADGVLALSSSSAYEFVRTNNSGTPLILQPNQTAKFFIVGYDYKATGSSNMLITDIAVYGTPVPEPATSALFFIAAAMGVGAVSRRKSGRVEL